MKIKNRLFALALVAALLIPGSGVFAQEKLPVVGIVQFV